MKQMQDGEKSCPNNCPTEIAQSKSGRDLRTLAHSNTHAQKGVKLKAEKPRPQNDGFSTHCIISYGIS